MKNNKKKGFTLIELLVVIAILAILATVSIVGYTSFLNKARMSVDQQLVDQINNVIAAESVVQRPENIDDVGDILRENGYNTPLVPTYSKYEYAYLLDKNVYVIVEDNEIVYPEKYKGPMPANGIEYQVKSKTALDDALELRGNVTIYTDLIYVSYTGDGLSNNENVIIDKGDKTITVDAGKTLTAGGSNGAIQATGNATVTLDGAGTVKGDLGSDKYSTAVFAKDNTVIKITNGYYTNETDGSARGTDLIYARDNARIEISGGTFKAALPEWTLNCRDNSNAVIIVSGGTFYQFNPETARPEDKIEIADGYKVIQVNDAGEEAADGNWYKVVKKAN